MFRFLDSAGKHVSTERSQKVALGLCLTGVETQEWDGERWVPVSIDEAAERLGRRIR